MSEEYAMTWLCKKYAEELGTWPLGMVKQCAVMMKHYADEVVEFKMQEAAKKAAFPGVK